MGNSFVSLPAPAANGSGAAVDVSAFGATKTVVVQGNGSDLYEPYVQIEVSNDNAGAIWTPIYQFQKPGSATFNVACRWMRATTQNYKQGGAPTVSMGGTDDGATFAESFVAPAGNGNGASVSVSALPPFKTVQISGTFKGTCVVQVSCDGGATWAQADGFAWNSKGGLVSNLIVGELMRIRRTGIPAQSSNVGLPICDIGAATIAGGGGGGGGGTVTTDGYSIFGDGSGGDPITDVAVEELQVDTDVNPQVDLDPEVPASIIYVTGSAPVDITLPDGPAAGYRKFISIVQGGGTTGGTLNFGGDESPLDIAAENPAAVSLIYTDDGETESWRLLGAPLNMTHDELGTGVTVDGTTIVGKGVPGDPLSAVGGGGLLGASIATTTVCPGNTETSIIQLALDAGTLTVGATFLIEAYCEQAGADAAGPTIRARIGAVSLAGTIATSVVGAAAGNGGRFKVSALVTIRAIGAGGTALGAVTQSTPTANATGIPAAAVAVDTTIANLLELTINPNTPTNSFYFTNATITQVKA